MLMKFENALQQEMRTKSTYVSRFKKATKKMFYITFPFLTSVLVSFVFLGAWCSLVPIVI